MKSTCAGSSHRRDLQYPPLPSPNHTLGSRIGSHIWLYTLRIPRIKAMALTYECLVHRLVGSTAEETIPIFNLCEPSTQVVPNAGAWVVHRNAVKSSLWR